MESKYPAHFCSEYTIVAFAGSLEVRENSGEEGIPNMFVCVYLCVCVCVFEWGGGHSYYTLILAMIFISFLLKSGTCSTSYSCNTSLHVRQLLIQMQSYESLIDVFLHVQHLCVIAIQPTMLLCHTALGLQTSLAIQITSALFADTGVNTIMP